MLVPDDGLTGPHREITLQVPLDVTFAAFEVILPVRLMRGHCHVVLTVAACNMTMADKPQGEPGAVVSVDAPGFPVKPFYFGIFPFNNDTDPFSRFLNETRYVLSVIREFQNACNIEQRPT